MWVLFKKKRVKIKKLPSFFLDLKYVTKNGLEHKTFEEQKVASFGINGARK